MRFRATATLWATLALGLTGAGMTIKTCPDCNGDGVVDKDTGNERQCPTCGGLRFVPDDDDGHEEVIKTTTIACKIPL